MPGGGVYGIVATVLPSHGMFTFTVAIGIHGAPQPVFMTENVTARLSPDQSCDEVEILADPQLVRAFYHLIDNSLRHGEKVSGIQIHCSVENNLLTIVYEDDGIGIPDRIRPVLFERGKGKNAGYGMFLVREILAATGIIIAEKGMAGKGARFEIIVPSGSFRMTGRR